MKKVKAVQDESGHWYLIPNDLYSRFNLLLECLNPEDEEYFINEFSKYMTGGSLNSVQLYIDRV